MKSSPYIISCVDDKNETKICFDDSIYFGLDYEVNVILVIDPQ
jgi:hypothetical protein